MASLVRAGRGRSAAGLAGLWLLGSLLGLCRRWYPQAFSAGSSGAGVAVHVSAYRCRCMDGRGGFCGSQERRGSLALATEHTNVRGADSSLQALATVRYLPSLDFDLAQDLSPTEGALVLPCFPLGMSSYVPHTDQVLQIFEPRYRQMYSDILMSGGRRFVVPQTVQDETGVRLAEVGVVFYLDDLREVSEATGDQIKYICTHKLIGRVRLKQVLNPKAFLDASTYLRVEAEDLVDTDEEEDLSELEQSTLDLLLEVTSLQNRTSASVSFNPDALRQQNATRGAGYWSLVNVWQSYLEQRRNVCQKQFYQDFKKEVDQANIQLEGQTTLEEVLKILPSDIRSKVNQLWTQFQEQDEELRRGQTLPVQELVQSDSHRERLVGFMDMVQLEKKNLEARLALQSVFPEDE